MLSAPFKLVFLLFTAADLRDGTAGLLALMSLRVNGYDATTFFFYFKCYMLIVFLLCRSILSR